jgi:hypothetical protein
MRDHLSLFFFIQFFRQCVNISFQHALAFTIERKIALVGHACSKSLTTIKSHNLYASEIRGIFNDITSYYEKD